MDLSESSPCQGLLLIDHENIPFTNVSLRQILECWVGGLPEEKISPGILSVLLRAYGGWYRESYTSEARFRASEYYQEECPSLVKVGGRYCRIQFEFADTLLAPPASSRAAMPLTITNTVAVRASAEKVVARPGAPPCPQAGCELSTVKKWIRRRRACTKDVCPLDFSDQFERHQQKQVDVHIATDMLTWAYTWDKACHLAVASDDIDLLPALGAAAVSRKGQSRVTLLRFLLSSSYLDGVLMDMGLHLVKL